MSAAPFPLVSGDCTLPQLTANSQPFFLLSLTEGNSEAGRTVPAIQKPQPGAPPTEPVSARFSSFCALASSKSRIPAPICAPVSHAKAVIILLNLWFSDPKQRSILSELSRESLAILSIIPLFESGC
ncbi:hypothetical protein U1Q18_007020 [Sarracenia purpurea var. burkii]